MSEQRKDARPNTMNLLQTVTAVLWSFFGVRRSADHDRDMAQLNPVHVVITGVILGILFVVSIVFVVNLVIGK